jgi:hypothetical protein
MLERGLLPDFSAEALAELEQLRAPAVTHESRTADGLQSPWGRF